MLFLLNIQSVNLCIQEHNKLDQIVPCIFLIHDFLLKMVHFSKIQFFLQKHRETQNVDILFLLYPAVFVL